MSSYVRRGAIAGLAGGAALALVLRLLGEQAIGRAVELEHQLSPPTPGDHEMFTRGIQQVGGMVAALVFGVALGVVFAVALALVRHRMAGPGDARRVVTLAAVAFVTIALVPFLKYPANPPSVGSPDTVTRRTILYLTMLAWSIVSTWAAWRALRWLRARARPDAERIAGTLVTHVVLVCAGFVALPTFGDRVGLPAQLIWRFRVASITGQATFWAVVGLTFAWLATRGQRANVDVPTPWAASPTPQPSAGHIGQK